MNAYVDDQGRVRRQTRSRDTVRLKSASASSTFTMDAPVNRHKSFSSFKSAVSSHLRQSAKVHEHTKRAGALGEEISPPTRIGTIVRNSAAEMFEHTGNDGRGGLHLFARQLVLSPKSPAEPDAGGGVNPVQGKICGDGSIPLGPQFIGGIASQEARMYQLAKLHHARFFFVPIEGAAAQGTIFAYYSADIGQRTDQDDMESHFAHLTQLSQSEEAPIWTPFCLEVKPDDVNLKYFDNTSGDYRTQVQGFVNYVIGSQPKDSQGNNLTATILGHVYMEYWFEFSSRALDLEVAMNVTSTIVWNGGTTNVAMVAGDPVEFYLAPGGKATFAHATSSWPSNPERYVASVILETAPSLSATGLFGATGSPNGEIGYYLPADNTDYAFGYPRGRQYWMRIFPEAGSSTDYVCFFYSNLADASNAINDGNSVPQTGTSDGQLLYHTTQTILAANYGTALSLTCSVQWYPIAGDTLA